MGTPGHGHSNDSTRAPRLVLLGASNLTRGLSCILGTARLRLGVDRGDLMDAMVACGHGRSYAISSSLLYRALCGVRSSGLWDDLNERPKAPTFALITDIGNDIMFDVPLHEIIEAIEFCLWRLRDHDARVVVTGLPMASIRKLTPQRYKVIRQILFPSCRVEFADAMDRAGQLDSVVRSVAGAAGATVVDLEPDWYGFDPIHIKWRQWPDAWWRILAPWNLCRPPARAAPSPTRWLRIRTCLPHHWTVLGRELAHAQPGGTTHDGTSVSMY